MLSTRPPIGSYAILNRSGLIQSASQVPWPGLSAWVEFGGIAPLLSKCENHEQGVLRKLLGEVDLVGVLIQAVGAAFSPATVFNSTRSRGLLAADGKRQPDDAASPDAASFRKSVTSLLGQRIRRSAAIRIDNHISNSSRNSSADPL